MMACEYCTGDIPFREWSETPERGGEEAWSASVFGDSIVLYGAFFSHGSTSTEDGEPAADYDWEYVIEGINFCPMCGEELREE